MTRAPPRVVLLIVVALLGAAAMAYALGNRSTEDVASRPPARRPPLLLLTTLPLMFGEDFSLEGSRSPVIEALEKRYRVAPISVTDRAELKKGRLLLMAHPLAQPAEDLVALDHWVRDGGRLLLLADPMLEWPSERPLGDRLRPPPMFMDTGLLAHWGLRLDAPDQRGPVVRELGGEDVLTASPGSLFGRCNISKDRLVAHCRIGRGRATIVADADVLDIEHLEDRAERNLDAVLVELARLERS